VREDEENLGNEFLEEEDAFLKGMVCNTAYLEYKKFRAFLKERGQGHVILQFQKELRAEVEADNHPVKPLTKGDFRRKANLDSGGE